MTLKLYDQKVAKTILSASSNIDPSDGKAITPGIVKLTIGEMAVNVKDTLDT
jgi:hypothetical protein